MKIRRACRFASVAALGAAVVVLPAEAGSETTPPSVVAENVGLYTHRWQPPAVTIEPGGVVAFSNPSEVPHGIRWVAAPAGAGGAPACSAGVPVGTTEAASGKNWQGTCTFAVAGTYTYYCTVHGAAMSGKVTVGAPSTTGTGTTTAPTTPTTTTTTSTGTTLAPGAPGPGGAPGTTPTTPVSAALSALRIGAIRHGTAVRGSLRVDPAAAGGTLTVELHATLGRRRVRVARLTRTYVAAGTQSWTIALSAPARRALRTKRHLVLSVDVSLTPPGGTPVSLTRSLVVRR